MISGQLGTAQLGLSQLGNYTTDPISSGSAPVSVKVVDSTQLNFLTLPDYFQMMGIKTE